jgi:hypothetical protein
VVQGAGVSTFPDIWMFNENNRVYTKSSNNISGRIIYRFHWRKVTVVGETRVSWIVSPYGTKIPKKGCRGVLFSQEDVDRDVWMHVNKHKISEKVRNCQDYNLLKKISELIGHQDEPEGVPG